MAFLLNLENMTFSQLINWIFFNPNNGKYDTLKSKIILEVSGENLKNNINTKLDQDPILGLIEKENNTLKSNKKQEIISIILNIITLTLTVLFSFFIIRKSS